LTRHGKIWLKKQAQSGAKEPAVAKKMQSPYEKKRQENKDLFLQEKPRWLWAKKKLGHMKNPVVKGGYHN
jgi:hypothetical protein